MKKIILSDGSSINSRGYKVSLIGMNLERFTKNPVMLFGHDQDKVIGRWENFAVENNKLVASPVFDEKDELGAETKRKVEENFLRGASIGIIVHSIENINDEWVVTKSELLEASIVSIPADAGAVVLYNENREVLSFEKLQLEHKEFKTKETQKMEKEVFKLSQKTLESLSLQADNISPKEIELAVGEKDKEIAELKTKLQLQKDAQVNDFLKQAVKAGKIQETERAHYEKLATNDFDSVKAIVDSKTESATATLADKVQKSTLSAGKETWDYMKWMQEDSKGLQKLKLENPKEFERLQTEFKNK